MLISLHTLSFFIPVALLMIFAPGPDILFTATQGALNGPRAGFLTALGLALGNLVHTLLAMLGVALLFRTYPLLFNLLKTAGVIYLAYLAWNMARSQQSADVRVDPGTDTTLTRVRRGFLMNLLNPKVAIFFLAFLPQFIDAEAGSTSWQMAQLGLVFFVLVVLMFGSVGVLSGWLGKRMMANPVWTRRLRWLGVLVFLALAIHLITITV